MPSELPSSAIAQSLTEPVSFQLTEQQRRLSMLRNRLRLSRNNIASNHRFNTYNETLNDNPNLPTTYFEEIPPSVENLRRLGLHSNIPSPFGELEPIIHFVQGDIRTNAMRRRRERESDAISGSRRLPGPLYIRNQMENSTSYIPFFSDADEESQ
ncbi:hypothetical protein HDU92_000740 [Lobulomyces angularis]|nr:hypothetical protein HDU92_000740 [Lobulomyces angularis]